MRTMSSLLLLSLLLTGCVREDVTGPDEVRWDREVCTRCAMAVGDRHFAAQVRGAPAGDATRVYKFDDIGCAVIWLDTQSWKDDPRTEVWVTDYNSGHWIDARDATYVTGRMSPMGYGLGAQPASPGKGLDYDQARQRIRQIEQGKQRHRGGHRHSPGPGE